VRTEGIISVRTVTIVKRFRGGLVFKAHRFLYYSTLGSRVIKKKKEYRDCVLDARASQPSLVRGLRFTVYGSGFRV